MPRPPRIDYEDAWHHVMNRGRNRQHVFRADADRRYFLSLLGEAKDRFEVEVHAFVLMPNHFHLLIHTPKGGLSQAMQLVLGAYTQMVNRSQGSDGALFKGRFRSLHIDDETYLTEVVRYIHNNPVKAGLARNASDYRWSSHRSITGMRRSPDFLNSTRIVNDYFGGDRARFAAFVDERSSAAGETLAELLTYNRDTAKLSERVSAIDERRPGGNGQRFQIECYVSNVCGVPVERLARPVRGRNNDAVFLAMTLFHHHNVASLAQIADEFGYRSRSGVAHAIARFEALAANDPTLGAALAGGLALQLAAAA